MATKIHFPAKKTSRDQTGLVLVGRHTDGRYQYQSQSCFCQGNVSSMTHSERVGLALVQAALVEALPVVSGHYEGYPMTKSSRYIGYGTFGRPRMWLAKWILSYIGGRFLSGSSSRESWESGEWSTVAHERGHNSQNGGRPHGPEFKKAEAHARAALQAVLWHRWPKLDMRKLRDSTAPHLVKRAAKKERKEQAACMTLSSKWEAKVKNAQTRLAAWESKLSRAENGVAKWEKDLAKAERWLAKAQEKEGS